MAPGRQQQPRHTNLNWPVYFLLLTGLTSPVVNALSAEGRLHQDLFSNYNRAVRPVLNVSDTVEVKVGLNVIKILDLDTEAGVLDMIFWLDFDEFMPPKCCRHWNNIQKTTDMKDWVDPSLTWNPADYEDVSVLNVPADAAWVPDIVISNLVSPPVELVPTSRLVLDSDGNSFLAGSYHTKTMCMADRDSAQQTCALKLMSWSYDGHKVNLDVRGDGVSFVDYIPNEKWELTGGNMTRNVAYYACCVESFPDVRVEIGLASRERTRDSVTEMSNFSPQLLTSQKLVHFLFSMVFFYICICLTSLK